MKYNECKKMVTLHNEGQTDHLIEFVLERLSKISPFSAAVLVSALSEMECEDYPYFTTEVIKSIQPFEHTLDATTKNTFQEINKNIQAYIQSNLDCMNEAQLCVKHAAELQ